MGRYTVRDYAVPTQQGGNLASNCCGVNVCRRVLPRSVCLVKTLGYTHSSLNTTRPPVRDVGEVRPRAGRHAPELAG